ncbi:hypothetical protein [Clavibacter tessellarius]|uniref:hypothetical protein n=1 Tax=Clavibacter tessellarius TaxID=31965 RepID=UPI00324FADB3
MAVIMRLHRLIGIGASEIARRVGAGAPLIDEPVVLARSRIREALALIEPFAHDVHLLPVGASVGLGTAISTDELEDALAPAAEPPPTRPVPDAELAVIVADAAECALAELPATIREGWCVVALVTSGRPCARTCA